MLLISTIFLTVFLHAGAVYFWESSNYNSGLTYFFVILLTFCFTQFDILFIDVKYCYVLDNWPLCDYMPLYPL